MFRFGNSERTAGLRNKSCEVMGRPVYAAFLVLFSVVYGVFLYYSGKYFNTIVNDMLNFRFSSPVKVAAVMVVFCIIVWFVLLSATIRRGRDIGFRKWQSVLLYVVPAMPRFFVILFALEGNDWWVEPFASVLWLIIAGLFLYLPSGWAR